ncbi:alpha/beta fold hydrolase [Litoribrevibacter euphylliae]|uniref:Alpha/beta fold hydrolase n=1 Tax=Litoribrevibacter euphylliae TaxID=1834034 RepID=A0ABV7HHM8_9GAMM
MRISLTSQPVKQVATPQAISLTTLDGYALGATRYPAQGEVKGNIVVAAATGVHQGFYRRFAVYASDQGFNVLTFDYRGIGQSKHGSLKSLTTTFLDWGKYDVAAAVDAMHQDDVPLFLVGHSFGGQALGLIPNHHLLTAAYSFGSGAGWGGWMSKVEALKVKALWNLVLPALVKWKGYMAWSKLGMGEDLPIGIYKDWKRWCQYPYYFFDDPELSSDIRSAFAQVTVPYIAATSTDDAWIPPKSRDAFCKHYVNSNIGYLDISPTRNQTIGHMGYFREECLPYWEGMLNWFREVSSPKI